MASIWTLKILNLLPNVLTISLVVLALAIGLNTLDSAGLTGLLIVVGLVSSFTTFALVKRLGSAEKLSVVLASSALLYVAIYVRPLNLISLYGLFMLIMMTGELRGLSETVRPIRDVTLLGHHSSEINKVLAAVLARLGMVLTVSFVLSTIIWISLGLFNLGPTSDFTAFILATVVIIILAVLSSLPE
ncbi:MAG: hypothetical protein ACE5IB_04435 [Candidatus Geothermarchaeales archaeon]